MDHNGDNVKHVANPYFKDNVGQKEKTDPFIERLIDVSFTDQKCAR